MLRATNRLAEAEPLYRRALAIDEASYGPDHPDVARDLNNLAVLLRATNRLAEAEPLYRRALAIDEASYGPDHPDVATDLNNLACCCGPPTAWPRPSRCTGGRWRSTRRRTAPTTPTSPCDLNNLAVLLRATNRLAEAEPLFRRAVEILLKFTHATGHEHPHFRPSSTTTPGCSRRWAGARRRSRRGSTRSAGRSACRWGAGRHPEMKPVLVDRCSGALGQLARKLFGR